MVTKLQKWGNSIAVRIPKGLARELGVQKGTDVDLKVENGRLVIAPVAPPVYSLDELLAAVTVANRHGEWDTGQSIGAEDW